MIRSSIILGTKTLTVQNLSIYDHLIFHGTCIQSVRWKKKPVWLPLAKSKMFKLPKQTVSDPEEYEELKRLNNNYRTLMRSLKQFFIEKVEENQKKFNIEAIKYREEKDFKMCSSLNEKWNKEVAAAREIRLAEERRLRREDISRRLKEKAARDLEIQQRVDAEVKKAKEEAVTFITSDNIDEAIQNALENVISHNRAINLNGNFIMQEQEKPKSLEAKI